MLRFVNLGQSLAKIGKNYGQSCHYCLALYEIQSPMWNHNSKTFATKKNPDIDKNLDNVQS